MRFLRILYIAKKITNIHTNKGTFILKIMFVSSSHFSRLVLSVSVIISPLG